MTKKYAPCEAWIEKVEPYDPEEFNEREVKDLSEKLKDHISAEDALQICIDHCEQAFQRAKDESDCATAGAWLLQKKMFESMRKIK